MALKIAFHGGKCCGIRHIHGFSFYPHQTSRQPALDKQEGFLSLDRSGDDVSSSLNVFYKEAPEESLYERLDRYIKFLQGFRPGGVIEVCLSRGKYDCFDQIKLHEEELFKHGFSVVTELAANSNTGNTIRIYHLITKG